MFRISTVLFAMCAMCSAVGCASVHEPRVGSTIEALPPKPDRIADPRETSPDPMRWGAPTVVWSEDEPLCRPTCAAAQPAP